MGIPHRLQPDTEYSQNLALLNDNFNKVVQDLRDLGANLSTVTTLDTGSLLAGTLTSFTFYLLTRTGTAAYASDRIVRTQSNITAVSNSSPLLDIYVDTDNSEATKWPAGATIAPTADKHLFTVQPEATVPSDALARYFVQVNNRDAVSHRYYLHFRAAYFTQGGTGVFR